MVSPKRRADVEKGELCDLWTQMRHDDPDPGQPLIREGADCDPAGLDVLVGFAHLGVDGVFALAVGVPGGRVPVTVPFDEPHALLLVHHLDSLLPVDLRDA